MGVQKKTRKFATVKRVIGQRDARLKKNQLSAADATDKGKKPTISDDVVRDMFVPPPTLFLSSSFCPSSRQTAPPTPHRMRLPASHRTKLLTHD